VPGVRWINYMHNQSTHKKIYDPFAHYTRGVLIFDNGKYHFTAYRVPYQELNDRTWKTEQAFNVDYRRLVERKYNLRGPARGKPGFKPF